MIVMPLLEDIGDVEVDGLVLPIDGRLGVVGGTAAARALKASFDPEDRDDELAAIESEVKRLRARRGGFPDGSAVVIDGASRWSYFVVTAALLHQTSDTSYGTDDHALTIRRAVTSAVHAATGRGLRSIAMTLIGDTDLELGAHVVGPKRLTPERAIRACAEGLAAGRAAEIEVHWAFVDEQKLEATRTACRGFGLVTERP
jgi:O-acetyl-ADP-ribose deacetylase (regulator of RNase III)